MIRQIERVPQHEASIRQNFGREWTRPASLLPIVGIRPTFGKGASTRRAPSDIYAGLESFVDLNALRSSPSAQSVNQPSPPSWEHNAAASIFGPSPYMLPPAPDLGKFVGPRWPHGSERAPETLMRGMHWHGVLPSADRPQTNIMINDRFYTAQLRQSGKRNDINVFSAIGGKDQASMPNIRIT